MEEDAGVKAPVTRLRRRLSVEQSEESKSPAVHTPTKRKALKKPELDLIDENTPENTSAPENATALENTTAPRTKKTAIKDVIDSMEDRPVTPSRRSTRIKSNTSIVSETAIAVGSPRAKRATRRASQVGSDNEAPATPVKTTRRTRKDSASNIEKVKQPTAKPSIQITEVIVEEPEITSRKSTNIEVNEKIKINDGSRKSPRLMKKLNQSIDKSNSSPEASIPDKIKVREKQTSDLNAPDIDQDKGEAQIIQKDRLSISSSNLIKNLDENSKKNYINFNKSIPIVVLQNDAHLKKYRTKSWTTVSEVKEKIFFSDNEGAKNKIKSPFVLDQSVSEDIKNKSLDHETSMKQKVSNSFMVEDDNKSLKIENNKSKDVNEIETDIKNQSNSKVGNENVDSNTSSLFEKEPSLDIKTVVVIEDSDSNSAKASVQDTNDSGDQCVPVVDNPETLGINQFTLIPDSNIILNESKNRTITDNSCEPMDVDETMPDSMVIAETETKEQDSNRKSLINNEKELNISHSQNSNKSKNMFSLSGHLDKGVNENESILISHDKETPVGSPRIANKLLSKTADDLDITQENENNKKNLSLNYLTSTPLQQKTIKNLVMQVNTSIIASNNDNKNEIQHFEKTPKKLDKSDLLNKSCNLSDKEKKSMSEVAGDKIDVSDANESIKEKSSKVDQKKKSLSREHESDESDEDVAMKKSNKLKAKRSKPINKISSVSSNDSEEDELSDNESQESKILDDEAEDMGDDYESGDSRDESERRFEKENEILEKGETLTSENDLSNDSDYEKDSFIVSSDEEDNELLEGTEDDLSMSDNELKMTSKSKKKYDERKLKEQKKASREMYESRHNINQKSEKVKKNNRQKLSSSESSESEKESEKPKKNNRMRLDSSHEASFVEGDSNKHISKKKTSRLSESVCDNVANEIEITIINESIKEKDPLLELKEEAKTPIKSANSTIDFIDSGDTNIDKNESTKTQTELMDPLEASMDDDNSLSSENEDIMQNYDSMLNDLNKGNKIKPKICDISLNLDKKTKKKAKTTIVDELNLTKVKSTKKTKNKAVAVVNTQREEKVSKDSGESSDSIDIHLLFSEDSNDSDAFKNNKKKANTEDSFIPLKRTEGKSNIREVEDSNLSLTLSAKKNKKRKSQIDKITSSNTTEDNNLSFFIDTEGTQMDTLNKSHNKSLKNNLSINNINIENSDSDEIPTQEGLSIHKQKTQVIDETDPNTDKTLNKSVTKTPGSGKKKSTRKTVEESVVANNSDSDSPMEVSYKKEKRESNIQDNIEVEKDETDFVLNKSLNKSLVKTPVSERKKKINTNDLENTEKLNISTNLSLIRTPKSGRKTLDQDIEQIENADNATFIEKSFNKSVARTPASGKKNKKSLPPVNDEEIGDVESTEIILNSSMNIKNKKKSTSENKSLHKESSEASNISINKTPTSGRKTLDQDIEQIENADNVTFIEKSFNKSLARTPASGKKNKKSLPPVNDEEIGDVESTEIILNSSMNIKNKKKSTSENKSLHEESSKASNISINKTPNSGRKTLDQDIEQIENADNVTFIEKSFNKSLARTPASGKKNKKSLPPVNDEEIGDVESTEIILNSSMNIKNKKKSTSENKSLHEESSEASNISIIKTPNSGKKKRLSESHLKDKNVSNPDISLSKSMTKTPSTDIKKNISFTNIDVSEEDSVEPVLNVSKIKTPCSEKKKIREQEENTENNGTNSKKRKRKSSVNNAVEDTVAEDGRLLNESLVVNQKKKRKISQQETTEEVTNYTDKIKNRNELVQSVDIPKKQKSQKRKERDDDEENYVSKVSKQNSNDKAPVSRLPTSLLKQLDDKPQLKKPQPQAKRPKLISTTEFIVEETKKRKTKPSNYLEESVYLNDDDECERKKPKGRIMNPKVLPFVPTASISNSGYTTNFKVNIVPKEIKFVAQSNSIDNFKNDYLYNKKIKRQGTYELYKRNRNLKISKF